MFKHIDDGLKFMFLIDIDLYDVCGVQYVYTSIHIANARQMEILISGTDISGSQGPHSFNKKCARIRMRTVHFDA